MEENYRTMHVKFDEDFIKLEFLSSETAFIPEEVLSHLSCGPLSCKPRFVLYCEGEKKAEIEGADFTKLEECVREFRPSSDD